MMTYGYPILKKCYKKNLLFGLWIALLIHIFVMGAVFIKIQANQVSNKYKYKDINLLNLNLPPGTDEDVPEPENLEIIQKFIPLKDLQALIPEPVAREQSEILTIKTQQALDSIHAPVSSTGDTNAPNKEYFGEIKIEKDIEKKIEKDPIIPPKTYQQFEVEKAPVAVNLPSIKASMVYPKIARAANIEGRVVVKVLVGLDGSIEKIGGLSGPNVFHNEIKRKITNLQFTPALQNGKPVKCWVSVPFNFKLK